MKYPQPLKRGELLRRYKRFLTDIRLPSGEEVTIHCPNTGSMKNCIVEGSSCWYSESDNLKRKYPYTWELATTPCGHLASVNTGMANKLVNEGLHNGVIQELLGYDLVKSEVKYGSENSRIDFLLSASNKSKCYVEVKSVTLGVDGGQGLFPDSVTARGAKHIRELMLMKRQGYRAVLFFCVQHTGIDRVSPADTIDPVYGQILREAANQGVELMAYNTVISPEEIKLRGTIPVCL